MLTLALPTQIYLCVTPTDMRKSFDSLATLVRDHLKHDPLQGHLFVFRSKRRDRIKLLYWDQDGYALWTKRLEEGTFQFPSPTTEGASLAVSTTDLALILSGIDLNSAKRRPRYQKPQTQDG
jgi:transposase